MFEGKKVRLRALEISDIDEIMKFWNNIDLRRELGPIIPNSRKEREDWIRQTWEEKNTGRGYTFAIEDKEKKTFLGHASLRGVRAINRTATVSIAIYNKENRGKGYGTDAMKVLLHFGFDYLNLHRIGLNVFETNTAAIHVYEKIGFTKVGLHRDTDFIEGKYVNDVAMDMLEDEWRTKYKSEF
ncbi:MAG: GNAT family N-acetyltransferase [Candidatus Heimdallarchaeota archaeon]|nr:GNAT family N-acetyltransferase [Candidatus Heimdallarchaeota archaeon]